MKLQKWEKPKAEPKRSTEDRIADARTLALDAASQLQDMPKLEGEALYELLIVVADDFRQATEELEALANQVWPEEQRP